MDGHGAEAADGYRLLLLATMEAVGDDPHLNGSVTLRRAPGVRVYPIRLSRRRVPPQLRVGEPRHLVLYREMADGSVEVLGFLHDRMERGRGAGRLLRENDGG